MTPTAEHTCLVCGERTNRRLRGREGGDYRYGWCPGCRAEATWTAGDARPVAAGQPRHIEQAGPNA